MIIKRHMRTRGSSRGIPTVSGDPRKPSSFQNMLSDQMSIRRTPAILQHGNIRRSVAFRSPSVSTISSPSSSMLANTVNQDVRLRIHDSRTVKRLQSNSKSPAQSTSRASSKRETWLSYLAQKRKENSLNHGEATKQGGYQDRLRNSCNITRSGNYWEKWLEKARVAAERANGGLFDVTCGFGMRRRHAVLHGARFGSGGRGKSIEYPPNSGRFLTPFEFEHLAGHLCSRKYSHSIKFQNEPIKELLNAKFILAHAICCKCRNCSNGEMAGNVEYHASVVEKLSQAVDEGDVIASMPSSHNDLSTTPKNRGNDAPPHDPSPSNSPSRANSQDNGHIPVLSPMNRERMQTTNEHATLSPNEQSSSSNWSNDEQPPKLTPVDFESPAERLLFGNDKVLQPMKSLRIVNLERNARETVSVQTDRQCRYFKVSRDGIGDIIAKMEETNAESELSYEQLKQKCKELEEKCVQSEEQKQRTVELAADYEQMQLKNRELEEQLQQQSDQKNVLAQKNCELEQQYERQTSTSRQLETAVTEMEARLEIQSTRNKSLSQKIDDLEQERERQHSNSLQLETAVTEIEARLEVQCTRNDSVSQRIVDLERERENRNLVSKQLEVTMTEMQSSVLRATEQLAHVQQTNATVVTENDLLRQQLGDKEALLDEYRLMDMKVPISDSDGT